ncbi:MAG TPA: methylmalonyl Co-A mutase-associated GTPase MeaB [Flavipsychrobacter sp.]|nr:methylmalonyl Co-A mutase-associated GTPase MeaB [Flavipsychrobacter sp.]
MQKGDTKSLARAITLVENELPGYEDLLLLLQTDVVPNVIGITGPPGAGKSTLVNSLIMHWVRQDKKIAVIAVDPSSPFNYGALLGDRIRMSGFYNHPHVYIRSLASRGVLGGLNAKILEITDVVKNAGFDFIIVETVGVGQSEVEIAGLADCTVVALVPEAGDEVQTLKAGIMEIADMFVVNKADRENAGALYRSLKILVHEKAVPGAEIPVFKTIATTQDGVTEVAAGIEKLLMAGNGLNEKKLHFLTEKAWQLIVKSRMKDLSKMQLFSEIERALKAHDFSLYHFIGRYRNFDNNG